MRVCPKLIRCSAAREGGSVMKTKYKFHTRVPRRPYINTYTHPIHIPWPAANAHAKGPALPRGLCTPLLPVLHTPHMNSRLLFISYAMYLTYIAQLYVCMKDIFISQLRISIPTVRLVLCWFTKHNIVRHSLRLHTCLYKTYSRLQFA